MSVMLFHCIFCLLKIFYLVNWSGFSPVEVCQSSSGKISWEFLKSRKTIWMLNTFSTGLHSWMCAICWGKPSRMRESTRAELILNS